MGVSRRNGPFGVWFLCEVSFMIGREVEYGRSLDQPTARRYRRPPGLLAGRSAPHPSVLGFSHLCRGYHRGLRYPEPSLFPLDRPNRGTCLWSETHQDVPVERGYSHVLLGSLNPLPDLLFTQPALYLEIQVNGTPLTPRLPLASVAYAFHSLRADTANFAPADPLLLDARCLNQGRADTLRVTLQASGVALAVDAETNLSSSVQGVAAEVSNKASGSAMARQFVVGGRGSGSHHGVYALAQGNGSASTYGVVGRAYNLQDGLTYAGYFYVLP